jgi:hypothetical protein
MLAPTGTGKLDWLDESAKLIQQAKLAEPNNPTWPQLLLQIEASRRQAVAPAPKLVK